MVLQNDELVLTLLNTFIVNRLEHWQTDGGKNLRGHAHLGELAHHAIRPDRAVGISGKSLVSYRNAHQIGNLLNNLSR